MAQCSYPQCECRNGPCPYVREDNAKEVCKNLGGLVGANGECLLCTAEAGETCR